VSGGTLLATLADMNKVHVATSVDEVDIGHVLVGQEAIVVADAHPDERFTGEVVRIAPLGKTEQTITTFSVIVLVQNRRGLLKAGMSASVEIEVFKKEHILLVPSEAIKDPRSEQGRAMLAMIPRDSANGGAPGSDSASATGNGQGMRERMQNASPEEREAMRKRFQERLAQMSPEERQRMMEMRQRGGGGPGAPDDAARTSQVPLDMRARRRVVMVREGELFVPRIIRVGVSNFDSAEVLEGLTEGDEVLTSTVSRAMISAQQFNERLRSRNSIGPASGGGRR
jgi:HlyD family secretion protein